jgi:hypothetical protein
MSAPSETMALATPVSPESMTPLPLVSAKTVPVTAMAWAAGASAASVATVTVVRARSCRMLKRPS